MPHLLHHLGVDANVNALDARAAAASGRQAAGTGSPTPRIAGDCMDWGTLAVYTCPDSCPATEGGSTGVVEGFGECSTNDKGGRDLVVGYVEEFVWRQPPP